MIKSIEYAEIDEALIDDYVLIDVRSPEEFSKATIPGAVNVPLFNDEQRSHIGTVYVQESAKKAKKIGIEVAAKNLPGIYEKIEELQTKHKTLIFFCARGGMRSSSLVALLGTMGVRSLKITGGYKSYRTYINEQLPKVMEKIQFVVIHGNTGTGKTEILKRLKELGHDMLDLEGCANHRGSLLGSVGLGTQNSQKLFESLIYEALKERKSDLVFVEGESKRIGKIIIPEFIFKVMVKGDHIKITSSLDFRVKNIMEEYLEGNQLEIIEALNKLRRYIKDKTIDSYIEQIEKGEHYKVVEELMSKYYDPMYENNGQDYKITIENSDRDKACKDIISWLESK